MVGIFGRANKGSPARVLPARSPTPPPPPYDKENGHDSSLFATATTTTTQIVTTTQTTTHFFSLPLWKRRGTNTFTGTPPRPSITDISPDELGRVSTTAPTVLMRDKDLPPTPEEDGWPSRVQSPAIVSQLRLDGLRESRSTDDLKRFHGANAHASPSSSSPMLRNSYSSPGDTSQPTFALARAALGLGLMPQSIPPTPPSLDINTVTFIESPASPVSLDSPQPRASQSRMRRARSFHKDGDGSTNEADLVRRRVRGLSLGPLHFGADTKGKERQTTPDPDAVLSPPRLSLSRKSSFWRKRTNSQNAPPLPTEPLPSVELLRPALPTLQPVSPFNVDTPIPSTPSYLAPESPSKQAYNLQRRHSDRSPLRSPTSESLNTTSINFAPPRRRPTRPQTTEAATGRRRTSPTWDGLPILPSPVENSTLLRDSPTSANFSVPAPVSSPVSQRPRALTNPPLLHRLSMNLFGTSPAIHNTPSNPILRDSYFSSPPSSQPGSARPSTSKHSLEIPRPASDEESPEGYLQRLMEAVSKAEIATVLASNADPFHARTLRAYIERFDFTGIPLDIALRRLLMDVGLPRETQQIDRVIEAFAARYTQCNPDLFTSEDHPYILAFSLIMLHTDAFNKSNKRKMTKADYIKNTRLPGVAPEVLECFYDNIVFVPFIFIEDPLDVNGQRGLVPESHPRRLSTLSPSPGGLSGNGSGSTLLGKSNKIDAYYLITRNLLDDLRVNIAIHVPMESPYYYRGTAGEWDDEALLRAFAHASVVSVSAAEPRYLHTSFLGRGSPGGPSHALETVGADAVGGSVWTLKVTKVGLLQRKDDQLEGGRKAGSRKWREWSVLLTGSQLLFFRDTGYAASILAHADPAEGSVLFPHGAMPRPDEMLSVRDAIAVYDRSYNKYPHTLRLAMPDGRQFLLQAPEEREMNEWIARINYASAFKTAGVRMRSPGMSGKDIELTGIAAAASHMRDMQQRTRLTSAPRIRTWTSSGDANALRVTTDGLTPPVAERRSADEPTTPPMETSSRLLKATFDQVKAELAMSRFRVLGDAGTKAVGRARAYSLESVLQVPASPRDDGEGARAVIVRAKVRELEGRIAVAQGQLDGDLRLVRSLGVLTPFQRATRDRLQTAVEAAGRRVRQVRLELEKLVCHRDVLERDLRAEEQDWQRTTRIALRAATETLTQCEQAESATAATTTTEDGDGTAWRPASSAGESFHSALEEWTGTRADTTPTESAASHVFSYGIETPERRSTSLEVGARETAEAGTREAAEETAEDWNKTRAAKRVSLVCVPTDLKIPALKHGRTPSDVPGRTLRALGVPRRTSTDV